MNADYQDFQYKEVTEKIYENAMMIEKFEKIVICGYRRKSAS